MLPIVLLLRRMIGRTSWLETSGWSALMLAGGAGRKVLMKRVRNTVMEARRK